MEMHQKENVEPSTIEMTKREYVPLIGLSAREQNIRRIKGRSARVGADLVSYGKTGLGLLVAANIASGDRILPKRFSHRSVGSGALTGVTGVLDLVDGKLGRYSEKHGYPILRKDKEKDPKLDKIVARWMFAAIVFREVVDAMFESNTKLKPYRFAFAGLTALAYLKTEDREFKMLASRADAVPGANTKSVPMSRYKTLFQNVGHTVATSPPSNSIEGLAMAAGAYTTSVILGEISLKKADRIHKGLEPHPSDNLIISTD